MTSTARPRLRALMLGGLVAGAFAIFSAAAPGAHAATLFTCGGSGVATYSPGITNTPRTVSYSNHWVLGPCLNVLNPLELRSGQSTVSATIPGASCLDLAHGLSGTRTISWGTGTSSTYSYNKNSSEVAGVGTVVVEQGTITSGDFAGDSILVEQVLAAGQFLNCATTGVTSADGPVEVTITG